MFTKLETPDTPEYSDFKKLVMSANFGWSYNSMATGYSKYVAGNGYSDLAFYSHSFLHGPSSNLIVFFPCGLFEKINVIKSSLFPSLYSVSSFSIMIILL